MTLYQELPNYTEEIRFDASQVKPGDVIRLCSGIRLVAVAGDVDVSFVPTEKPEAPGKWKVSVLQGEEEAVQFVCDRCGAVHYGRRYYASMCCPCGNIIQAR